MTEHVVLRPVSESPAGPAVVTVMPGAVGAHVGLHYQASSDGARQHLHLAWHLQLENDPAPPPDACWVEPRMEELALANVARSARLIAKRHQDGLIPYALDPSACLTPDATLQGLGLTCATFIVQVFEHARARLLDTSTWDRDRSAERRREDEDAQRRLVAHLRRNPESEAHAALVERQVGCTRLRAEEVAAAAGMTGHPIPFVRAEPAGRRVLAEIRGQTAGLA